MLSVPPPSLSIIWKHLRAAFLKSLVNSSISLLACLASSSRLAALSASLFARATSMHSSLREHQPVSHAITATRHRRVEGTPNYRALKRTTRQCPRGRRCPCPSPRGRPRGATGPVWKSNFYGAFVLNHSVVLHASDATPARWRGDAGSSPLDRARTATSLPRNDLVKNCRVYPTHWLISTQQATTRQISVEHV